jgi:hypothetical protein
LGHTNRTPSDPPHHPLPPLRRTRDPAPQPDLHVPILPLQRPVHAQAVPGHCQRHAGPASDSGQALADRESAPHHRRHQPRGHGGAGFLADEHRDGCDGSRRRWAGSRRPPWKSHTPRSQGRCSQSRWTTGCPQSTSSSGSCTLAHPQHRVRRLMPWTGAARAIWGRSSGLTASTAPGIPSGRWSASSPSGAASTTRGSSDSRSRSSWVTCRPRCSTGPMYTDSGWVWWCLAAWLKTQRVASRYAPM